MAIQEKEITHPELLQVNNVQLRTWKGKDVGLPLNLNILGVAVHPGGLHTVSALLEKFINTGYSANLLTGSEATKIEKLHKFNQGSVVSSGLPNIAGLFKNDSINLLIASSSLGPEMELETATVMGAIKHKKMHGETIITYIEDATDNLTGNLQAIKEAGANLQTDIDAFLLSERSDEGQTPYSGFLEIPKKSFIVAGAPGWDIIRNEDTYQTNLFLRKKYGIDEDDIVITHFASRYEDELSPSEIETTPVVASSVNRVAQNHPNQKIVFIYRNHPSDEEPEKLHALIEPKIVGSPDNLRIEIFGPDQTSSDDGRHFPAIANLCTTYYSSTLTGVALRGARGHTYNETGQTPLYYLPPEIINRVKEMEYKYPVAVRVGAAFHASSPDDFYQEMEKALFDEDSRLKIFSHQADELKHKYRFRGSTTATDRAFLQILNLIKKTATLS